MSRITRALQARCFDPRPHARGDTWLSLRHRSPFRFRSTPPREGRLFGDQAFNVGYGFDPRPHARGDQGSRGSHGRQEVSIHAPTRGATAVHQHLLRALRVSIHAPTRGATATPTDAPVLARVSIHAPTRGATGPSGWRGAFDTVSIHAPTRGATKLAEHFGISQEFRSTPPREGRPTSSWWRTPWKSFDPRPHARGDGDGRAVRYASDGFDPRPHARGDRRIDRPGRPTAGFDPRPHARGDSTSSWWRTLWRSFDPRPHARGDKPGHHQRIDGMVSIHAPTRGATLTHEKGSNPDKFRSTPPREGRPNNG